MCGRANRRAQRGGKHRPAGAPRRAADRPRPRGRAARRREARRGRSPTASGRKRRRVASGGRAAGIPAEDLTKGTGRMSRRKAAPGAKAAPQLPARPLERGGRSVRFPVRFPARRRRERPKMAAREGETAAKNRKKRRKSTKSEDLSSLFTFQLRFFRAACRPAARSAAPLPA